jgi:hypothetical protein
VVCSPPHHLTSCSPAKWRLFSGGSGGGDVFSGGSGGGDVFSGGLWCGVGFGSLELVL